MVISNYLSLLVSFPLPEIPLSASFPSPPPPPPHDPFSYFQAPYFLPNPCIVSYSLRQHSLNTIRVLPAPMALYWCLCITSGGSCLLFLLFTYLSLDWVLLDTEHTSFTSKTTAPEVMNNYDSLKSWINKHLIWSLIHWDFQLRNLSPGIYQSHCSWQPHHMTSMAMVTISLFPEAPWKSIFDHLVSHYLLSALAVPSS